MGFPKCSGQFLSIFIERLSRRGFWCLGMQTQSTCITSEAWDNVQVCMENCLPGGAAVRQEEIHRIASQSRCPQRFIDITSDDGHPAARVIGNVLDAIGMIVGDDQGVPGVDRVDVQERRDKIVLMDDTGFPFTVDDVAKHTAGFTPHSP